MERMSIIFVGACVLLAIFVSGCVQSGQVTQYPQEISCELTTNCRIFALNISSKTLAIEMTPEAARDISADIDEQIKIYNQVRAYVAEKFGANHQITRSYLDEVNGILWYDINLR